MTSLSVKLFIDGEWCAAHSGETLEIINPSTEEVIGSVACADTTDIEKAATAAAKGFRVWRKTSAFDRSKIMRKAADIVRQRVESIAQLLTLEQGKPLGEARLELLAAADIIDWFAEEARRTYGRVIPARTPSVQQAVIKEPVGPVAAFTPWNFPVNQAVRKISAALAAGCSEVLKAPEETPASPAELVRAFHDAGLPSGVLNLVYGRPAQISEYLIPHPIIKKISFTGSTVVGKHLAALAGTHMKRATMELGGHGPVIVFDDVAIDEAAKLMAALKYRNAGQVCASPTRFLVQAPVYDRFVDQFVSAAKAIKVGDGMADGTQMGALANSRRLHAMEVFTADAEKHGARLLTGGRRIGNKGYYFEPTVLADVPISARAMNEEPFGPLALIRPFSGEDDAITEANRLNYGLGAFVFTRSLDRASTIADELECGMVSVNHNGLALPEVPFGGVKDSGYGSEGGAEAIENYLNTKLVSIKR